MMFLFKHGQSLWEDDRFFIASNGQGTMKWKVMPCFEVLYDDIMKQVKNDIKKFRYYTVDIVSLPFG